MLIHKVDATQDRLKQLLEHDNDVGHFRWLVNRTRAKKGDIAGSFSKATGYWRTCVDGKRYMEHRLVWVYYHGSLDAVEIDHINGNKLDNRIENLRISNRSAQLLNVHHPQKSAPYRGVWWQKRQKRWQSSIMLNGKSAFLGTFKTAEEARAAYLAAKTHVLRFNTLPQR